MKKLKLNLTIVITAYNEENHIGACLDAIVDQIQSGDEIIVVDNASTDKTRLVVSAYDSVRLLSEPKIGRPSALITGFDSAKGDVIVLFNADVIIDKGWLEHLRSSFSEDDNLAATTGLAKAKILPALGWPTSSFWSRIYLINAEAYFGTVVCWGANMAITSQTWKTIREGFLACDAKLHHDDQFISLLVASAGLKTSRDNQLLCTTKEQSYYEWPKFRKYVSMRWRTKRLFMNNGSYALPNFYRLNFIDRLWRYAVSILPVTIFVVSSLVGYPYFWIYRKIHG